MKKILICNIPMTAKVEPKVYACNDKIMQVADMSVCFPVNAFLAKNLKPNDELKVLLIAQDSPTSRYAYYVDVFKNELNEINKNIGSNITYVEILSTFDAGARTQKKLLENIVDKIDVGSQIFMDITYGSKDIPIVDFTALTFAEKFLKCEIEHIFYGQVFFDENNKATNPKVCDMVPLFYLNSIANLIRENDPERSKETFKKLLNK